MKATILQFFKLQSTIYFNNSDIHGVSKKWSLNLTAVHYTDAIHIHILKFWPYILKEESWLLPKKLIYLKQEEINWNQTF